MAHLPPSDHSSQYYGWPQQPSYQQQQQQQQNVYWSTAESYATQQSAGVPVSEEEYSAYEVRCYF